MKKTITKTINVDDISKSYDFSTTITYPYWGSTTTSGYYRIQINNPRKEATLERDIDKNIKNIRIVYEIEQEILDEEEKEYLSNVIKPFRNDIEYISKYEYDNKEYIYIDLIEESFSLPMFEKNTMYRGMKTNEEYTLEELGL